MDTLARICKTLDCDIMDVIELVSDEPSESRLIERYGRLHRDYRKHGAIPH
ncbi:MAG: helix-turn-helix domain-containing protein [Lachnospiraceae bacterium]|nr:helix-turn-helix domain-containing protein [Lachnospiraceae bacterium]